MTRRRTTAAQHLTRQALELSVAAPVVVAQRLTGMALAGPNPNARERREMVTMGTEKVAAFWQGWSAMGWQMMQMQTRLWQAWLRQPWQLPRADVLPLLSAGLAPVHRRAVANAKRLTRKR